MNDAAYQRNYERAASRAHSRYMRDAREFALVLHNSCPLSDAFLTQKEQEKLLVYLINPDLVRQRVEMDTAAARALHQIWRAYALNDAELTGRERTIGNWLSSVIAKDVDIEAAREAEGELEYEPARLRGAGAI